ncbi:MAG: glycosyltransferase family 4 protein [Janthinobacterium lividum]
MVPLPPGMVVLQVLPRLDAGGVERGTVEMAQAIAAAGGTALVASEGGRLVGAVERAGGRHLAMPLASKNPAVIWRNAGRLARLIRAEGVGIVHARSRAPAWSAWLAARRTGARFVTTYHGVYNENLPGKRRYNAVMARGERVIAISRHVARVLMARHGVAPARIRIIPRGVDPVLFDPGAVPSARIARLAQAWRLPDGVPTVMLPARLTRWKGAAVLIEAVALMRRRDVCCILVGAGRDGFLRALERQAAALGVAERLRFAGHCDDMAAALMLADVVVSASLEPEGFGRTVIEAQAMGRPVVVTDHGGAAETVEHLVTGWRIPPGDAAALAVALDHALQLSLEDRQALGGRARAAVCANFTTAAMQAATLEVYREVLASAPAPSPSGIGSG